MKELIKKILESDNLITIILAFITSFLTVKNNQRKTASEFFKKEGIKVQERLLDFWTGLLMNDLETNVDNYIKQANLKGKYNVQDITKIILKESMLYSSKSTIKAIGAYQQYIFKNKLEDKKSGFDETKTLVLPLRVTKRMKYDVTGERVSEIDVLKVRINDLNFKKILQARIYIIWLNIKENSGKLIVLVIILIFLYIKFKK